MSTTRRAALGALALVFAVALVRPVAAQQEDVTLALPATNLGFAPAYIADAKGFWKEAGLNVKMPVITGIGAMNALLAKSVEFCISSGLTIIRANIRGQKVMQVANTYDGLIVELVVAKKLADAAGITIDSPIAQRAAALKGKKIAVGGTPNALPHGYLRLFARKGGIDPERDVQIAVMQPEAAHAAVRSGAIDGFVETLPQPLTAIRQGYGTLISSGLRGGPGGNGDFPELLPLALNGIMTRPDLCQEKPALCAKFVGGIVKALAFLHDSPKESVAILHKVIPGMDEAILEEAFALTIKSTPRSPASDDARFAKAQELMVIARMIKAEEKLSSFQNLYTNKFIK